MFKSCDIGALVCANSSFAEISQIGRPRCVLKSYGTLRTFVGITSGLELALEYDAGSKIIQLKLEQARKMLSQIKKEPPPPSYRTMPIQPEFAGKLAAYCMEMSLSAKEEIFPVSRIRAYQIVQSAAEKAGIEKPRRHPHVFRHGFAVNAVTSGVPPLVLRNWMGHADIHSTLIYTEALAEDTKSYMDRMKF